MRTGALSILISRYRRSITGTALVEFSLLLPMLVLLMAGIGEFGRAIYQFQVADKGVKAASRFLARVPSDGSCPPTSAAWTAGEVSAKILAQRGSLDTSTAHSLSNWTNVSDVTIGVTCVDNSSGDYKGPDDLPIITVSTSFVFDDLGLLGFLPTGPINITASHQELYIGD